MPYVIKPRHESQRAYNALYRALFNGLLPADHHNCSGVECDGEEALEDAMNDLYKAKIARHLLKTGYPLKPR